MGEYHPCNFDRQHYLESEQIFEGEMLGDVTEELTEFNNDMESLACELAYTRYRLAKVEKERDELLERMNNGL